MSGLDGKVAVITGGNSGIGRASAVALANAGAKVVIFGRDPATLDETLAELGDAGHAVRGDVADMADLDRLFAEVKAEHGRVDVLFANAGIAPPGAFADATPDDYDRLFDVNVKGLYFTVQKALPLMGTGGRVILTSSCVARTGGAGMSLYCATKGAVSNLVLSLSVELADRGILVNAISPGPIETAIFTRQGMPAEQGKQMEQQIAANTLLGRFGTPGEIAAPVLFLAGEGSSYLTGSEITADGGYGRA